MPFEKYVPPKREKPHEATLRKTGTISIPTAFSRAHGLSDAPFVTLYFEKDRKLVGVKPAADAQEEGAVKVSRRQRVISVPARSFFEHYGVPLTATRRCPLRFDTAEGMAVISLGSVKRRPGRRRSRA